MNGRVISRQALANVYTSGGGTLANAQAMATRAQAWVPAAQLLDDRTTDTLTDAQYAHELLFKMSGLSHDGVPAYHFGKLVGTAPRRRGFDRSAPVEYKSIPSSPSSAESSTDGSSCDSIAAPCRRSSRTTPSCRTSRARCCARCASSIAPGGSAFSSVPACRCRSACRAGPRSTRRCSSSHRPPLAGRRRAGARAQPRLPRSACRASRWPPIDLVRQRVGADFHVVLRGALYEREQLRKFQPTEVALRAGQAGARVVAALSLPAHHQLRRPARADAAEHDRQAAARRARRRGAAPPTVRASCTCTATFRSTIPAPPRRSGSPPSWWRATSTTTGCRTITRAWTNRELMNLLDSRSVLIVGMSLTDPNVRRLLAYLSEHKKSHDEAHDHFVILQQRPPVGDRRPAARRRDARRGRVQVLARPGRQDPAAVVVGRAQLPACAASASPTRSGIAATASCASRGRPQQLSRARLRRPDDAGDRHGAAVATTATTSCASSVSKGASSSTCSCR